MYVVTLSIARLLQLKTYVIYFQNAVFQIRSIRGEAQDAADAHRSLRSHIGRVLPTALPADPQRHSSTLTTMSTNKDLAGKVAISKDHTTTPRAQQIYRKTSHRLQPRYRRRNSPQTGPTRSRHSRKLRLQRHGRQFRRRADPRPRRARPRLQSRRLQGRRGESHVRESAP